MWMLVHPIHLVLSSATLSNEIFCIHFWLKIKNCMVQNTYISLFKHTTRWIRTQNWFTVFTRTYYLWMGSIIIPTHHYFGCNCNLPLFSKITHHIIWRVPAQGDILWDTRDSKFCFRVEVFFCLLSREFCFVSCLSWQVHRRSNKIPVFDDVLVKKDTTRNKIL